VAAVPDRISILLFFRLGRGCKQCVTLDICRNNFLSATDVRSPMQKALRNMLTICTVIQTDNHTNTVADALPDAQLTLNPLKPQLNPSISHD